MNKYIFTVIGVAILVSAWFFYPLTEYSEEPVVTDLAAEITPKVIKYRVQVSNPSNVVMTQLSILVAMPLNLARQSVSSISVSEPYEIVAGTGSNSSLKVSLPLLAPYQTRFVDILVSLNVHETPQRVAVDNLDDFTKPERFIESDNPQILSRAKLINADSKLKEAKLTYDWVTGYLSNSGFIKEDRGALYALRNKSVDCTGYMYLYGALLRANAIPARMVSGFVVKTNKSLKARDYHNWVEVYLDGAWRVVDPQNRKFLQDESDYIAMRIIDNSAARAFQSAQQLVKAQNTVRISMN